MPNRLILLITRLGRKYVINIATMRWRWPTLPSVPLSQQLYLNFHNVCVGFWHCPEIMSDRTCTSCRRNERDFLSFMCFECKNWTPAIFASYFSSSIQIHTDSGLRETCLANVGKFGLPGGTADYTQVKQDKLIRNINGPKGLKHLWGRTYWGVVASSAVVAVGEIALTGDFGKVWTLIQLTDVISIIFLNFECTPDVLLETPRHYSG